MYFVHGRKTLDPLTARQYADEARAAGESGEIDRYNDSEPGASTTFEWSELEQDYISRLTGVHLPR